MKAILLLAFCLSAAAGQTTRQNGLRVGGETVFLLEPLVTLLAGGLTFDGRIIVPPSQPAARADFETWVEGIDQQYAESITTGSLGARAVERPTNKTVIQRWVRDNFRHLYIRYSVTLEVLADTGTYRATFGDFDAAIPKGIDKDWKVLAPPTYPTAQLARDGDTIPLQLYINQARGQRLIEYIHLGQRPPVLRKDAPRDVYTDAPEFDISQPKFRLNGVAQALIAPPDPFHGAALWIYVPGEGRFDLSFKPAPGFESAGEAWGNSLMFVASGNLLRLEGADRIAAAGSAPYRIYVRTDAGWLPEQNDRSRVLLGVTP